MTDEQTGGTLEELAATRETAEDDYLAHVRELEGRVAKLLETAAAAEAAARQSSKTDAVPPVMTPVTMPEVAALPGSSPRRADQAPWPAGGGPFRAVLNGLARWWLRDYLAVLDARHEALAERSVDLETDLGDAVAAMAARQELLLASSANLSQAMGELHAWAVSSFGRQSTRAELLRDGLNRAGEAIDLVAGASLRLRTLMNAKNAETMRRAVGGVDQKAEVVLDALARRQEALLAQLVGRRQELDELVAGRRVSE